MQPSPPQAPSASVAWQVLFYADADFVDGYDPLELVAAEASGDPRVGVLILEDPFGDVARVWRPDAANGGVRLRCVEMPGEPNMGSPETLGEFARFADVWYPADRRMLMIYGHGHAWRGACYDDNDAVSPAGAEWCERDWLSPVEMQQALANGRPFDAVLFTAPCLMASLEAAYQLRHVVRLYVASQEHSGYMAWIGSVEPILGTLAQRPYIPVAELGVHVIDTLRVRYRPETYPPAIRSELPAKVMSAVDTARLDGVAGALDAFSLALLDVLPVHRSAIAAARHAAQSFGYNELIDIADFASNCASIHAMRPFCERLQTAVDGAVLALITDAAHPGARGLTLYFPAPDVTRPAALACVSFEISGPAYRSLGLSLLADTHWDEFLSAFFNGQD